MIVYRGSKEGKIRPWIHPYSRLLDYGTGFYVTPNKEYAETLAMARGERDFATDCEVVYDFDEEAAARCLKIKHFYAIDNGWKDFIISNRTGISSDPDYDIIYGPAPSPTDYYFFLREESPFAYTPFEISMIKEYREINNYHNPSVIVFKTEKSLSFLKYVDRYGLPRYDENKNEILYNTEISIEKGVKEPSQFTLEILVKGIIEYAATRTQLSCRELIRKFYASNLYYDLAQMDTRVWCLSYVALGETFVRYLNTGDIVYPDDDVIMNLEDEYYINALELYRENDKTNPKYLIELFDKYDVFDFVRKNFAYYGPAPSMNYDDLKEYIERKDRDSKKHNKFEENSSKDNESGDISSKDNESEDTSNNDKEVGDN